MGEITVTVERHLETPPDVAYAIVADFNAHHAHILPRAFRNYRVERGGHGAGTIVSVDVNAGGPPRRYRLHISEPQPGRVLVETDEISGTVTTWTFTPGAAGTNLRIQSTWRTPATLAGTLERLLAPPVMRRMYHEELSNIENYARSTAVRAGPAR